MASLVVSVLSPDEARSLTDEVKRDAERLWAKLVELYEGRAHHALGYSSWGAYFQSEFGGSRRRGYELLNAGRVLDTVRNSALQPPSNEAQANELVALLDEPERLREAWAEASADGEPTALKVREAVEQRLPPKTPEELERQHRFVATINVLDGLAHFDREPSAAQAEREAALLDSTVAAKRGETLAPERLRRASAWTALLADSLERTQA